MKERIRSRSRELGFDLCGFTAATPPDHANHFETWLSAQHHGEMSWIERNAAKRVDPQKVLPSARSIICLAVDYGFASKVPTAAMERQGVIARYAQYQDYHQVLGVPLRELTSFVNELGGPGTISLCYVDTGPLMERDLAQRAGIGFVGKHNNLIHRHRGNWLFLAEILTTLSVEPDPPEKNHCGKCVACIKACPTHAITAPFQLDARKCISYLTIELKGSIPLEHRRAIGNRIYGCDDCLAACPWNRFAREGRLMRPHVRPDLASPDLLELLALDEPGFKSRFAGTPILRTKRRGFLRNVCVALGNVGDRSALPALKRAAHDAEPLIAEHAAWAIAEIEQRTGESWQF